MATTTATATASFSEPPTRVPSPSHTPAAREIPTDFRSSLAAWWASSGYRDARIAEDRMLRRLSYYTPAPPEPSKSWFSWSGSHPQTDEKPFVPPIDPSTGFAATVRNVFIPTPDPALAPTVPDTNPDSRASSLKSGTSSHHHHHHKKHCHKNHQDYINTLEISRQDNADSKEAVVVLHGYAAAQGFFFRNWDPIARSAAATGRRTFFLDWLGMGLSSRPNPALLAAPSNAPVEQRVARAEHFFLSSLESWRASVGLEKMVLVGHSLGGYLATAYALRYPERVSSLILVSPVGIPRGELNLNGSPGPAPATKAKPAQEDADNVDEGIAGNPEALEAAVTGEDAHGEAKQWQQERENSAFRRGATKMFLWGWDKGLSPFSVLRGIGPWGPMLVGKYSSRRFASQSADDVRDLHSYIYGTSTLKGSGEFCISHILKPGAYARLPLIDRVDKLKIPVSFLYGDNDWMDLDGGRDAVKVLEKAGNAAGSFHVVPQAGHHLYLDNPEVTNGIIDRAIRTAPRSYEYTPAK
ncbi:putative cardiolipin-specific deacylase, mitochondrial [Vanrija pseudolonga]|uniref:Cardiolipin-specific deacylase, mitochondrial n=1 Tax=Vanrija pseudolonga TaxID=143232 RepID=A0AAF0YDL6_9TREE|nr:putative cardiolipin-specific deacylase, mitochondrial [Vanrija pseudolonga]